MYLRGLEPFPTTIDASVARRQRRLDKRQRSIRAEREPVSVYVPTEEGPSERERGEKRETKRSRRTVYGGLEAGA